MKDKHFKELSVEYFDTSGMLKSDSCNEDHEIENEGPEQVDLYNDQDDQRQYSPSVENVKGQYQNYIPYNDEKNNSFQNDDLA